MNFDPPKAKMYPDREVVDNSYQGGGDDECKTDKRSAYVKAGRSAYT